MTRTTHTTKGKKAKCLAYRNGKRCGRVARAEVKTRDRNGYGHQSVCQECATAMMADGRAVDIIQESVKGFTVFTSTFGPVGREYRIIR